MPSSESAKPLLHLLDILTVHNIYVLHALKFTHLWHKGLLPNIFQNIFKYANTVHNYNTRYAANQNLYKSKVRTNIGKQRISSVAIDLWKDLPSDLKDLNVFLFSKNSKRYLCFSNIILLNYFIVNIFTCFNSFTCYKCLTNCG